MNMLISFLAIIMLVVVGNAITMLIAHQVIKAVSKKNGGGFKVYIKVQENGE